MHGSRVLQICASLWLTVIVSAGALTNKIRNTAATVPHHRTPIGGEDRNTLNAAPEAPPVQGRPNASGKRKPAAAAPNYRHVSPAEGKRTAQPAENNHNGTPSPPFSC